MKKLLFDHQGTDSISFLATDLEGIVNFANESGVALWIVIAYSEPDKGVFGGTDLIKFPCSWKFLTDNDEIENDNDHENSL